MLTVHDQQVNVIRGGGVIENVQAITLLGFEQPIQPTFPVSGKFEKKFFLVAPMCDVPDLSRNMMPIRSCHSFLLKAA